MFTCRWPIPVLVSLILGIIQAHGFDPIKAAVDWTFPGAATAERLEEAAVTVEEEGPAPSPFDGVAAEALKIRGDVPYAGTANPCQTLDVYAPAEGEGRPIVLWIHGGGWQGGDKRDVGIKPQAFVDRGYVFVSAGYRLIPEVSIKEMAGDVAKALRWARDHAAEFGGDPDRIVVAGHSAGAQLATLVTVDDRYLGAEWLSPSMMKGCVSVDGEMYDVPMQLATHFRRREATFCRIFGDEATQEDISAINHVTPGKPIPPLLILHVVDYPGTWEQTRRLVEVFQSAELRVDAVPVKGKDHETLNNELGTPGDLPTQAMFRFLDEMFGPGPHLFGVGDLAEGPLAQPGAGS